MELKTVNIFRAKDMTQEQRKQFRIRSKTGIVAIERYGPRYIEKVKVLQKGIFDYILNGY